MTATGPTADAALVQATLAGDREAFTQIVARYQTLLCSLAYSATGSLGQSEDLAQETFVAAWKHLPELREPPKLRAWLCGILRNLVNHSFRSQQREPSQLAGPLEDVLDFASPEPLPVERAISQEEADLLWRSLERIPEIYRVPLVLFYREQQSVEEVAGVLDLTENAVKQRMVRGRKLLQNEILTFVQGALRKSAPAKEFTVAVLAALPASAVPVQAASSGIAALKAGATLKSASALGALSSFLGIIGAMLFSWKTAVDESRSPAERRLLVRSGWVQMIFLLISIGAMVCVLPRLGGHPVIMSVSLGALLLAATITGVVSLNHLNRRRTEIVLEEGTWATPDWSGPGPENERKAKTKAAKLIVPFVFMCLWGSFGLPWREHSIRSASILAFEGLIIYWAFLRFRKMQSGQSQSSGTWLPHSIPL